MKWTICSCDMSYSSESGRERQEIKLETALLVIGIGVRFPFLSYRASAKVLAQRVDPEGWIFGRRTEESVGQRDRFYLCHRRIVYKIRIDEEEDRHINALPGVEPLFFEAKALDFAEIWSHLSWSHTVGSNPNDVLSTLVRSCVKCERCLPW